MTEITDMLTHIEKAIIRTLKQQLPQQINRIEAFDDRAEEYDFPQGDGGAVFVLYTGSSYGPNDDAPSSAYAPRRTIRWQVYVLVRSLRGKNDKLDARIDGGWRYVLDFTHHIPAVADIRFDAAENPAFERN